MGDVCQACGQKLKLTHKETMSKTKLSMLKEAASHVMETMRNDVPIRIFAENSNFYNNFQKLRYHGLIHHLTKNGIQVPGHWLITRNGWAFLRGEITLPKYVLIKENRIASRSDQQINVRDVYYGSDAIQTVFEYFDDFGKPVGFKRVLPQSQFKQVGLGL